MRNFSTILSDYASIVHKQQQNNHQIIFIDPICSSNRIISSTAIKMDQASKAFHGWS